MTSAKMRMFASDRLAAGSAVREQFQLAQTLRAFFFFSRPPHRKKKGEEENGASNVSRDD